MRCVALLLVLLVLGPADSQAQIVRPPDLRLQFHRAERAFRSGSSGHEAKARLDMVLEKLPDDVEALILRARVLLSLDQAHQALIDARRAVDLAPDKGEAWLLRCEAARAAGEADEAVQSLTEAGALISDGADLHLRLSYNAQMLGLLDQAEAFARLAHTLEPTLPAGFRRLAHVFVEKGRIEAAATLIASGLAGGYLDVASVASDEVLKDVRDHPAVSSWFGG